jgi:hypothetical protein
MRKCYHIIIAAVVVIQLFSCTGPDRKNNNTPQTQQRSLPRTKPPSRYPDTLKISSPAAVFYFPDSLQLQKIRSLTDAGTFDADMHEYEFLFRTAHAAINKNFPGIRTIEAKNIRYLFFISGGNADTCIDLDKNYDPYGLYLFNGKQRPHLADMANIETELGFIFR